MPTLDEIYEQNKIFEQYFEGLQEKNDTPTEKDLENLNSFINDVEEKVGDVTGDESTKKLLDIIQFWLDLFKYCLPQNIYLKITKIPDYSPVYPDPNSDYPYRVDCFRRAGHEDGTITDDEVQLRKLTAVVYQPYTDETFTDIDESPLIDTDITEPSVERRVPGVVVYTRPGRRLRITVLNDDSVPHSLHMHGVQYGIDSHGAYPFGVKNKSGVRSDQICPGGTHTYVYDVTREMTGCWVFHDHFMHIGENARLGVIGGLIVRDSSWPRADLEVPFFMHTMAGRRGDPLFDSLDINPGQSWSRVFQSEGTYDYRCFYHGMMAGKVVVQTGADTQVSVDVRDNSFEPEEVLVAPGGEVTWTNNGVGLHTVYESGSSSGRMSHSINGRSFAGNTPVIEMETGQRIRWYVFNHDFGGEWHNFHIHASHWTYADQHLDNRSIGPAEAFVVDTIAPPVLLPPCKLRFPDHEPKKKIELVANYPIHCHVEPHVMAGMVALMRVRQIDEFSERYLESLDFELPVDGGAFTCPVPDMKLCVDQEDNGSWQRLPDAPEFAVHGAVLRTGKIMIWSGHAEVGQTYGLSTALFDPSTNLYTTVPFSDNEDLFCAGHAFLPDGRLVAGGGANQGQVKSTHIFDPISESWSRLEGGELREFRWYPTMITMSDGRIAIVSGTSGGFGGVVEEIEVLNLSKPSPPPGTAVHYWDLVSGSSKSFSGLYPGFHWLPSGEMFFSRTGWNSHVGIGDDAAMFTFSGQNSGSWSNLAPLTFPDRKEGCSVILIDDSEDQPTVQVLVLGGRDQTNPAISNCEIIELTDPQATVGWTETAPMNHSRIGLTAVILPNGRVMAVGGRQTANRFDNSPVHVMACEIYDPETDTWALTPEMAFARQYHSVALLMPDCRVFTSGGVDMTHNGPGMAPYNQQTSEVYSPEYLSLGAQPSISNAPGNGNYGETVAIQSPNVAEIVEVSLLAPGAITHHTDTHQRYIKLKIDSQTAAEVNVRLPGNANVAPPGNYMLFLINNQGVPSAAHFIRLA